MAVVCGRIAQIFGTTTLVTFTIGGFFVGQVADRCFVRRLKTLLIGVLSAATITFVASTLCIHWLSSTVAWSYWVTTIVVTVTGLFAGATMPLILELLAETAFPVPEGTTVRSRGA